MGAAAKAAARDEHQRRRPRNVEHDFDHNLWEIHLNWILIETTAHWNAPTTFIYMLYKVYIQIVCKTMRKHCAEVTFN